MMNIEDILKTVKANAEEDRALAKKRGHNNTAVYFQGKIVACNEIKEIIIKGEY